MADFFSNYVGVLLVGGLVLFYIAIYYLNKKTPVPEECLDDIDKAACNSCKNFACAHKG